MAYSREAHDLLNEALETLKTKANHPYARMVGYLIACVPLEDAKMIAKIIEEWEGEK